uniref:RNA polymerase beta' subunit n=1 Tax=Chaetoceros gelidus TaxID=1497510 RepID=UPI002027AF27|nr:RNA polymerase beta' subunit [Chaetoceros gelidus]UPO65059.1 RNA polymerase beta' subunit [Chaetoceros gelidus]
MVRTEKEFDYIKIKLASPVRILQWSHRRLPNGQFIGEVQKSETINYRTFKPEMDGLFCERIFGPSKSLECACGKYKRVRYDGLICERCGVELTESRVRRHRMGHINLIYPVTHVWYTNSRPNYMALLLEVEQCEKRVDTGLLYYLPDLFTLINTNLEFSKNPAIKEMLRKDTSSKRLLSQTFQQEYQKKFAIKSGKVNLRDNRIKRIKLASLAYFIAEDEISFYGLHWDLQQYRRSRELGFTGYPLKPYPKPTLQNRRRNTPKYLLRTTPNYLIGAVLIKKELEKLNINKEISKTRRFITICSKVLHKDLPIYNGSKWFRKWEYQRIYKLRDQSIKRIRILENLQATGSNPAWMVITILPVIPPALRPMIQLEGGRFATSDLNELYRRIITRNNRLLRLLEIDAPQLIIRNEKRMLQEAVDTLIDNGKRGKIALSANNRPLKSLSDIIKGKHGRFRQNLLGKRVDYSGRSVIVVGPSLKLNQCGLPYEMAIELFQPFIIRELINQGLASNMKVAKNLIQQNESAIDPVLEKVLASHPIFLNRAPTLHRLGIQAFEPILVQGRAIKLHPLVCSAFNADFDGDQMAVHVPLSLESQAECYMLMLAPYNFLSPANGEPIIMPSQDMVLGCYYLTVNNINGLLGSNNYFANLDDVVLAYYQDQIELHTSIWVRYNDNGIEPGTLIKKTKLQDNTTIEYYDNVQIRTDSLGQPLVQYIQTTTGRVIFNYTIQKTLKLVA